MLNRPTDSTKKDMKTGQEVGKTTTEMKNDTAKMKVYMNEIKLIILAEFKD
jgi:hypothetical protein